MRHNEESENQEVPPGTIVPRVNGTVRIRTKIFGGEIFFSVLGLGVLPYSLLTGVPTY